MSKNLHRMVVTAMLLALGTGLSMLKVFEMPMGGSVTLLSMLPIALISIKYGFKWGAASAFLYSLIQMAMGIGDVLSWGSYTPMVLTGIILLDYIVAFSAISLSGIFRSKGPVGICLGIALALGVRTISHVISGTIFFSSWAWEGWNPLLYSLAYNGLFMVPEMVITMIASVALFYVKQVDKLMLSDNFRA